MGTGASVEAETEGIDHAEVIRGDQGPPGSVHEQRLWKRVQALRMAAKGLKILRPGQKLGEYY